MKISYSDYPVLAKLLNDQIGEMDVSPADVTFFQSAQWKYVHQVWEQNKIHFQHEVNILSENFVEAAAKASNKFLDLYKEMILSKEYVLKYNGTFIEPGGYTYMLRYEYNEKKDHALQVLYWFIKNRMVGCFYLNDFREESELWICEDYKKVNKIDNPRQELHEVTKIVGKLLVLKLFKDCARVKTIWLPPKSKTIDVERTYLNMTFFEITILDSLWLSTLVKSDLFNVHGHFDVKICGKNLKGPRLKWIHIEPPSQVPA